MHDPISIQSDDGIVHTAVRSSGNTTVSTLCDWFDALDRLSTVTDKPRVGRVWPIGRAGRDIINCMACIACSR